MRHVPRVLAALYCCLPMACLSADAEKDPKGWGSVKFGMTPDEVLESLGPDGYVAAPTPQETQRPFGLDETTDIPAALAFAKQQVAKSKEAADAVPEDLLTPCKTLIDQNTRFTWVWRAGNNPLADMGDRKKPPQRISGVLESITSWGAKGTGAYRRTIHVKTARATVPIEEVVLDPDSKKKLARIEDAITDIALAMQNLEEGARRRDAAEKGKPPTPADKVKARPVEIRGIQLMPSFGFDQGKIVGVHLENQFAGDGGFAFDHHGMQATLVDALQDKFGRADEKNNLADSTEYVWRFPNTVIRCKAGCVRFPDSTFTRKYVSIKYEQPAANGAPSEDKL